MSLFDNNVLIFGLVTNLNRSLSPDAQQSISIETENVSFRVENRDRWSVGWMKIGAIIGENSNVSIELNADGVCTLRSGNRTFAIDSFQRCVGAIIDRIGTCFSCDGIVDQSYVELDAVVASYFLPQ